MKKNAIKLTGLACIVALCMALAACAPAAEPKTAGDESGDAATEMAETGDGTGAYVSDEQCLSCHGGSFEAPGRDHGRLWTLESPRIHPRCPGVLRELPREG